MSYTLEKLKRKKTLTHPLLSLSLPPFNKKKEETLVQTHWERAQTLSLSLSSLFLLIIFHFLFTHHYQTLQDFEEKGKKGFWVFDTMVPSCFSHSSISSTLSNEPFQPQSLISCIYQTNLFNHSPPTLLTLTWSLSLSSHSLYLHSSPSSSSSSSSSSPSLSTTISLSPSSFSLFSPTSKSISLPDSHKLKLHWDFSKAKYTPNSAQPISSFYLAITCDGKLHFFIGDLLEDFARRAKTISLSDPSLREDYSTLLSRREHVFERRNCYVSRVEFLGSQREIAVELCSGILKVSVDGEVKLVVKRLAWKFRGNERLVIIENYYDSKLMINNTIADSLERTTCQLLLTRLRFSMHIILMRIPTNWFYSFLFCPTIRFFISGNAVDFFWDVFNWVKSEGGAGSGGPGVFVFQVGEGGVWPEVIGAEGKLMKRCLSSSAAAAGIGSTPAAAFPAMSPAGSNSSVLQWAEESSSDGGRSSCSSSSRSGGINGGFSLLLYAWRKN